MMNIDLVVLVKLELLVSAVVWLKRNFKVMGRFDRFQLVYFCFMHCLQEVEAISFTSLLPDGKCQS